MARGFRLMSWGDAWLPDGGFGNGGPVVALGLGAGHSGVGGITLRHLKIVGSSDPRLRL